MESFMAIIVDGVRCKMETNWVFLGVIWTTWGPFLDAQGGLWKYLDSVFGRLMAVSVKVEVWRPVLG